jgi:hypothetical protein
MNLSMVSSEDSVSTDEMEEQSSPRCIDGRELASSIDAEEIEESPLSLEEEDPLLSLLL